MFRILMFIPASAFFLYISRRSLRNPRAHGFYRFFVFEGILILFLMNAPYWFHNPFSIRQATSLAILLGALYCVLRAVRLLRKKGGRRDGGPHPENLAFENTEHLVTEGIYGRIRHPMYASLLMLAWGVFLKNPGWSGLTVVSVTTVFIGLAARMEELENLAFFGSAYQEYMRRTKRFIPHVF